MSLHFAFLALGLLAAAARLPFAGGTRGPGFAVLKTVPMIAFTGAAISGGAPAYLAGALMLLALGDFALARPGRAAFLYGLSAFGLAHLVFIVLFQSLGGAQILEAFATAPPLATGLLLLALSTEIWLAPYAGRLAWPLRGYIVLITGMGLAALALPAGLGLVTTGAALFIASDLILALRLFRIAKRASTARPAARMLWALYISGQALIVIGLTPV